MSIQVRFDLQQSNFRLNIDLAIAGKGVTAIFGPSGCGKTTLLRAIAGLERIDNGYLSVGDQIWQDANQFLAPHKRSVGYVFQEPSLFDHLSVHRNIEYGLKRAQFKDDSGAIDQAIELLDIGHLGARMPNQLSGGEQQRVAIARALAAKPKLLLLDEPLAALDETLKAEILPYLESLHRDLDIPVLYVSHSRQEVARLADQLLLLDSGEVTAYGKAADLFSSVHLPLAHQSDAETIFEATVADYDAEFGLTTLDFPGGHFFAVAKPLAIGTKVRLQVLARDVSITLDHQQDTSILNIFPVTIDELLNKDDVQMTARLMAGSTPLLSKVTRKSAQALDLKKGDVVYAQVKTVALLT